MNSRLKKLFPALKKQKLDALIVSDSPNITYLTGYPSRDSILLVSRINNTYFTDSRYAQEAKRSLKGSALIKITDGSISKLISDSCKKLKLKRIGFEEQILTYGQYRKLKEHLDAKAKLVPTSNLVEELRQTKTETELRCLKKAVKITVSAFEYIKNFISAGKKEIEVAAELEHFIRFQGARSSSFDIIVASGPNSSFPHHITSQRVIKNNEPVLIDMGVEVNGYKSDLTRVLFLGRINSLYQKVYGIVQEAQTKAIAKIKPAVKVNEIDGTARHFITQKGYGSFFGHALGHGIGLNVHEAPRISGKENAKLKPGMVLTVEPGIYLPGKFGIRIEDMVYVNKKGCEVLSGSLNK